VHTTIIYSVYRYCVTGSGQVFGETGCKWYYQRVPNASAWVILFAGAVLLPVALSLLLFLFIRPGPSALFDAHTQDLIMYNHFGSLRFGMGKYTNSVARGVLVVLSLITALIGLYVPDPVPHLPEYLHSLRHTIEPSWGILLLTLTVVAAFVEGMVDSDGWQCFPATGELDEEGGMRQPLTIIEQEIEHR